MKLFSNKIYKKLISKKPYPYLLLNNTHKFKQDLKYSYYNLMF